MKTIKTFEHLGLPENLLKTVSELGYETPTPVQAESIPILLERSDLLAQAQTGTGKTAAFALPILANINLKNQTPQALIIAPTRELAIQVSEAFQAYAKRYKQFRVVPIYGGHDFSHQLRALKRGAHVIVGTPGRLIDHIKKGTLNIQDLQTLVLDEADEMLKMGFIEDVEFILSNIKSAHQTALFSATIPNSILSITKKYLNNPKKVHIKTKTTTVDTIEQSYIKVNREQKLDILTNILALEEPQATIIFARTKTMSAELAEKLQARGHLAAALNGDMSQSLRKKVVDRIKNGTLDIIVATDVAARGIDVERISHVINYDIPYDTDAYVHRIGRTGRAGRTGKAIMFVTKREHHLLKDIERATNKTIERAYPPSEKVLKKKHNERLIQKIMQHAIENQDGIDYYEQIVDEIKQSSQLSTKQVAATLISMTHAQKSNTQGDVTTEESNTKKDHKNKQKKPRKEKRSVRQKERAKRFRKPSKSKPK